MNSEESSNMKHVLESKTLWVNLLAIIAFFVQQRYGFVMDETTQTQILFGVNMLLRLVTKDPVSWK